MKTSKTNEMKTSKTLRLKDELIKRIEKLADKEKRTFTNMVEVLLDKAVKK
jgi:predicted transcriptional regulator